MTPPTRGDYGAPPLNGTRLDETVGKGLAPSDCVSSIFGTDRFEKKPGFGEIQNKTDSKIDCQYQKAASPKSKASPFPTAQLEVLPSNQPPKNRSRVGGVKTPPYEESFEYDKLLQWVGEKMLSGPIQPHPQKHPPGVDAGGKRFSYSL